MPAGLLFLLQKYFKIASTKSRNLLLLLLFFSIFYDDDDDDDVIMTSFTDILKTCIPIHLCLKCIMGLRYAWLPPAHCFNKRTHQYWLYYKFTWIIMNIFSTKDLNKRTLQFFERKIYYLPQPRLRYLSSISALLLAEIQYRATGWLFEKIQYRHNMVWCI